MTSIKLTVTGAEAWASVTGILTSGMVGIPVTIEYDEAWNGLTKNLMCRCSPWGSDDGEIRTRLNVGEASTVAHEVMQPDMYLYLGVEGFSADGTLVIPTAWAKCGKIEYGANTCEDPSTDPELTVWNQIQAEMEQIRQDVITPELVAEIKGYAQSATKSATNAERAKDQSVAASNEALSNAAAARNAADTAQASSDSARTSASSAANLANGALQAQRAAEAAAERAENAAASGGEGNYVLPIGGEELGGVKNGGNVTINPDGTMDAPVVDVSDAQIAGAVAGWLEEHPEATTTVADHSLDPNKNTWMRKIGPINLYNPAETVAKTEIIDNGDEVSSTYMSCTGYIPVTPGVYVATGAPWYYAIYKADKTFIKRFGASNSAVFDLSAQPEAAYLRLMYYGVPNASTFMVCRDALPDAFVAYDDPDNTRTDITDETVKRSIGRTAAEFFDEEGLVVDLVHEHAMSPAKISAFDEYQINLFDASKMEEGSVGGNGGDVGYAGNYRSPYIPVVGGETYYLYTPEAMGTNFTSWVYDADKNPVWRIPEGTNPVTVPADVGAAYMRIGSVSEGTVVSIGTPTRVSIPHVPSLRFVDDAVRVDIRAYLMGTYGKRVYCIGDSITAGYSESGRVTTPWPMILNRDWRYNATNYGITSTTLSTAKANGMSERLKSYDPAECDICLVMGGFNDGTEGVPMGDIDSTDTATVYGALNDICNTLVTRYSGKRYGLITTPKYEASTNNWNIDTAIREVGAKWGVPVLDLHKCMMPIKQTNEIQAIYCADGVHPLDPGQEILARIIAGWIPTL